jgi:hypothetical protein
MQKRKLQYMQDKACEQYRAPPGKISLLPDSGSVLKRGCPSKGENYEWIVNNLAVVSGPEGLTLISEYPACSLLC